MKSILISIQPQHTINILTFDKVLQDYLKKIEIRKTFPKCEFPIDVYIYCTKSDKHGRQLYRYQNSSHEYFIDDRSHNAFDKLLSGYIVAKFTLKNVEKLNTSNWNNHAYYGDCEIVNKKSCLTPFEIREYTCVKSDNPIDVYAWHIDNLQIFEKLLTLQHFRAEKSYKCIMRPPQSYCYVVENRESCG